MLSLLVADHFDELAADLMETYGTDLWAAMDGERSPESVAALAVQLPSGCRWRTAIDPDAWWTGDRLLMANLVNLLAGLSWGLGDPKKRGPKPKPIGPTRRRKEAATAMSKKKLLAELSKRRFG